MKDDLISKTSVCEIIADIYPTDGEKVVAVKEIDKAYEAIQQLPSAQPEIIHCKYCKNAEERGCALFCGFWTRYTAHKGYCFKAESREE